jgi:signal transduction histidine kinase
MDHLLWEALFTHVRESVVVLDDQQQITECNDNFIALAQQDRAAVMHKKLDDFMPLLQPNSKNELGQWQLTPTRQWITTQKIQRPHHTDCTPIAYQVVDITDDEQANKLVIMRDLTREQELTELRSEFVSIVSHQLRTPASAVKWYLETLIDNRRGNEVNEWQVDKLHQAYQSNERMISLINDLLNVSRLDSGKFILKPIEVSLVDLFKGVQDELYHFAHAHNVDIVSQVPADLPAVKADIDKLREVVLNLVNNAIKYSQSGHREVTMTATVKEQMIECSVQDQGIGIPAKDQAHIFEKFYRADNAIESQTEGSGLGLYIAREIIRLHGGDIWLTSSEGVGTTVLFTLPIYGH